MSIKTLTRRIEKLEAKLQIHQSDSAVIFYETEEEIAQLAEDAASKGIVHMVFLPKKRPLEEANNRYAKQSRIE